MPKIVVPSMSMIDDPMDRIALALERMSPPPADTPDFDEAAAFLWHVEPDRLAPVQNVNGVANVFPGIEVVDELPKTATGKIQRFRLRDSQGAG